MITLKAKIKQQKTGASDAPPGTRISVRDQLLVKEVPEMESQLPRTCKTHFDDHNKLHQFTVTITPDEGYWQGGKFKFHIDVPLAYNMEPPEVRCSTRIWHPNINEDGEVCLSILRLNTLDTLSWAPTRKLHDVVSGLNSLFTDLLNFDDPLNVEAADHYQRDKDSFVSQVRNYIQQYAKR